MENLAKLTSRFRWPVVFTVIAAWWALLDRDVAALGFLSASAVTLGLALAYPRLLSPLDAASAWLLRGLGLVLTHFILASVYFLIVTPIGIARRIVKRKPEGPRLSYWVAYPERQRAHDHYERMF